MSWRRHLAKFRALFRRSKPLDVEKEIRVHLQMEEQENVESGMSPEEARYAALRRFGNVTLAQERSREMWVWNGAEALWQDIRYGLRQLRRSPGFTAVAVLTLALGIGLNTSIFTLFDAATLRALPVKDPTTVVNVYQSIQNDAGRYRSFSYPEYVALRDLNGTFSGLIAYSWIPAELDARLAGDGTNAAPTQAHGLIVSGNYFSVLGGQAALGHTFALSEGQIPGAYPVLVLSQAFWQRRLNSDRSIVGKVVKLNGTPFTVVGIARQDFVGTEPEVPDFWAPLMMQAQLMPGDNALHDRGSFWLNLVGRLKPGISVGQAQASINLLISRLSQDYLGSSEKVGVTLTPGSFFSRPDERGEVDSLAFLVLAAVGMVLLIACANVASLVLARAAGRQREIGIRLSLGASRGRLIRQLLTESALMALIGGGVGLLLAWRLPNFLIGLLEPSYEQTVALHLGLDIRVLGYTLALSLTTALIFGLAPALQTSKPNLVSSLKDEGTAFGPQFSRSRFRSLLVVAETAICLVLLLGAGLLVRALEKARQVDPGFDTKHVLVVSLDLGFHGYDDNQAAAFHAQFINRLRDLPAVKSASVVSLVPLGGVSRAGSIMVAGKESPASSPSLLWDYWVVSPNYFETLGIPILQGRSFSAEDQEGPPVAIINEAMARRVWPGESPLGKRFRLGPPSVPFTEIVGVVKDTRGARLWEADKPYVYLPLLLSTQGPPIQIEQLGMKFLIRAEGDPDMLAVTVPRVVKALDPNVQAHCSVLQESLGRWVWFSQLGAVLSGAFGLLAVVLAVVGVYGVMSYSVTQRTREMGIRMALGASHSDVLRAVVGQGLRLTLFGVAAGLLIGLGATRVIAAMLYGVKTTDPATFALVTLVLILVTLLACYIPARRATKVDPIVALRYE